MKRSRIKSIIQNQKHDASSTSNRRGMAKRSKRQGVKSLRQVLKKELNFEK